MPHFEELVLVRGHPMCRKKKFTHVTYVDDLIIFYKGTKKFKCRVIEALKDFSKTIGLYANQKISSCLLLLFLREYSLC